MKSKKILAGKIMKVSPYKVRFVADALEDIKKAITRSDIRGLIAIKKIVKDTKNQKSRSGARKIAAQKKKGRQKGAGKKKGSKNSVVNKKRKWITKIRAQRVFLKELSDRKLITKKNYSLLYTKSKGGYFRNKRHIKLYLKEQNLIENK
jgi:large subunit ribosomal protein L19e